MAKRHWSSNNDSSNVYGLEPNFGCCTANMHQGWPKFVAHMWMATHDHGLAAVAYGPSVVRAKVADGTEVVVREVTDYPFGESVRFEIRAARPVSFPLHLRIPGWARGATLIDGEKHTSAKPGEFLVVNRRWQSGDVVELKLPMPLRVESRYHQSVAVYRGPLVFSLKIGERFDAIKRHHSTLPAVDWSIQPTTPWNYALAIDRAQPERSIQVAHVTRPGKLPFAQETAPIVLSANGRAVPEWKLVDNSAGDVPTSPVVSDQPLTKLELIPYGCTRLRITEFPVLAK